MPNVIGPMTVYIKIDSCFKPKDHFSDACVLCHLQLNHLTKHDLLRISLTPESA